MYKRRKTIYLTVSHGVHDSHFVRCIGYSKLRRLLVGVLRGENGRSMVSVSLSGFSQDCLELTISQNLKLFPPCLIQNVSELKLPCAVSPIYSIPWS